MTATEVSAALTAKIARRAAPAGMPTVALRSSPEPSTLSQRPPRNAPIRVTAVASSSSAGRCVQLRSPASQNTMPRSWPLSASVSSTVSTAPQALANTTPHSNSRVAPPPRANSSTASATSVPPAVA